MAPRRGWTPGLHSLHPRRAPVTPTYVRNLTSLVLLPLLFRVGSAMASSTVRACPSLSWLILDTRATSHWLCGRLSSFMIATLLTRDPCEVGAISNVTGDFGETPFSNGTKTRWQDVGLSSISSWNTRLHP